MTKIERAAEKLAADWRERAPYEALQGDLAPVDLGEAYRIQRALNRLSTADRGPVVGRKIALSSKAMQEMVSLDNPIAGAIHANDVFHSPAEVAANSFRHLGTEYELAFEIKDDIAPREAPYTAEEVLDHVAAVRPAFELIEDKGADYSQLDGLTLTADNAWCGGIVLGDEIDNFRDLDLADLPAVLEQNGEEPEAANTGAASPLASLAWVMNHVTEAGDTIAAGEQIITGSVLRTRFPRPGDRLRYVVDGRAAVELKVV